MSVLILEFNGFNAEKEQLLQAERAVFKCFQADDTTARIHGTNGYTLHIGNELFACSETTPSKSRLNFLEVIRNPYTDYVFGGDAKSVSSRRASHIKSWHPFESSLGLGIFGILDRPGIVS